MNAIFLNSYILEVNLYDDLFQHVKEHYRKRLFPVGQYKGHKKIPNSTRVD